MKTKLAEYYSNRSHFDPISTHYIITTCIIWHNFCKYVNLQSKKNGVNTQPTTYPPPPPPHTPPLKNNAFVHTFWATLLLQANVCQWECAKRVWKIMFVCFITKSFLTYSFFPPTPALSRPLSSSMCSITSETANVGSIAITACEVQVSAADSQTVPTVANGV